MGGCACFGFGTFLIEGAIDQYPLLLDVINVFLLIHLSYWVAHLFKILLRKNKLSSNCGHNIFRPIAVFCGTDNIRKNIPHIQAAKKISHIFLCNLSKNLWCQSILTIKPISSLTLNCNNSKVNYIYIYMGMCGVC